MLLTKAILILFTSGLLLRESQENLVLPRLIIQPNVVSRHNTSSANGDLFCDLFCDLSANYV